MHSLRGRFILSHLIPLLIIVPLTGIALLYILEAQLLLTGMSEELSQQANQIAETAYDQDDIWSDSSKAQSFIGTVRTQVSGQIWLLQPTGHLLASSDPVDSDKIGQHQDLSDSDSLYAGQNTTQLTYSVRRQSATISAPVLDIDDELVGIVQVTRQLEGVSSQFGRLRWYILGVLAGELILGGIVGLLLALRLERPIRSVTTAVTDIASGQSIENLSETGPDEIRLLVQAVNTLSERLRTLEETRRRLLANLVHELGRPLGALRAAVHVLRHDDEDPAVRQELLAGMETEIERLEPLLNDLTQLHGQLLGGMELDTHQTAILEWLTSILAPWQAAAQEKGLTWQQRLSPDLPTLLIDPSALARAIGNLLSNAVKYTPAGRGITVTAECDETELRILVADTGPGIDTSEKDLVFDPFYRGHQQHRFPKGLGLGLTIAQEMAAAHHGRISLDSTPGQGSCFTIHLPLNSS